MRLLLYVTPVLWSPSLLEGRPFIQKIMNLNPIHYIVQGYRDCFFFHEGILAYSTQGIIFWAITIILLFIGSYMMYKFKRKFIDLL